MLVEWLWGLAQWPALGAVAPYAAIALFSVLWQLPLLYFVHRMFASQTEGELKVTQVLREKFPQATAIKVTDISGKAFSYPSWEL